MTLFRSASARRAVRLTAAAIALFALATRLPAMAVPLTTSDSAPVSASLEASSTAVPLGGALGYTAQVRLTEPASYLQVRLQVHRPSGQLVYQRTQILNGAAAGTSTFSFSRPLDALNLKPGVYPLDLSVRATIADSDVSTEVAGSLLVYDAEKPPVTVVVVAKIHGQPLRDPEGKFVVDPAIATRQRDDAERIATLVNSDPAAHVTLAVPPMLLEEWRRIGGGYTAPDGTQVPSSDPTPQAYATALTALQAAIATGRLELVSLGYADPNLTSLSAEKLVADTSPQYDAGFSATFASLETTASTGTVPAGGCVPAEGLKLLADRGVGYIVADTSCVRIGKSEVAAGSYPIAGARPNALASDVPASKAVESAETTVAMRRVFDRLGTVRAPQPLPITVDLGDGFRDATSTVVSAIQSFEVQPWVRLRLGRETVPPRGAREVRLVRGRTNPAPAGFWPTVRGARKSASAMLSALGPGDTDATQSQADSLLAEASAWEGPNGKWALASRGKGFASSALRRSRAVLGRVRVTVEPVTLAGAKGQVPVTIVNNTQKTLSVIVRAKPSGGLRVLTPTIATVLRPRENFIQIPVDTQAALGGRIDVQVVAGDLVIAHQSAEVRASYLDRLAVLGAVFVVLGILLAIIVRRVRRAGDAGAPGADSDVGAGPSRYTDANADEMETQ